MEENDEIKRNDFIEEVLCSDRETHNFSRIPSIDQHKEETSYFLPDKNSYQDAMLLCINLLSSEQKKGLDEGLEKLVGYHAFKKTIFILMQIFSACTIS